MKDEIKTEKQLAAIEKETREFTCPCCDTRLQFRVAVNVKSVGIALTPQEAADRDDRPLAVGQETLQRQKLVEDNAEFLAASKRLGVFDAFHQAVDTASLSVSGGPPKDKDKYFIQWMKKAAKQNAPQFALRQCLNGAAGGNLELWGWMNVSAILQDGLFRVFIPRKLINGEDIKELALENGGIVTKRTVALPTWVRTKYGYVERSSEFANELRKNSIGGFAL